VVSESGIKGHEDVKMLQENRITAILVGETLMRSEDRAAALRHLMGK
jgi:indole-3-glycerol phosphate synthase